MKMKVTIENLKSFGVGAASDIFRLALDYAKFMFWIAIMVSISAAIGWMLGVSTWEAMPYTIAIWVFFGVKEARKDCNKAVRRVDALKDVLILTYSTTKVQRVGDREFESIATQGQAFREKATGQNEEER
jgi:hypothetical protein